MKKKLTRLLSLCLAAAMLLGLAPVFAAKTPFTDVEAGSWYEDPVAYFSENGFVKGVSRTEFAPTLTMTRAMVVTILCRMGGGQITHEAASFSDVPEGAWFAESVAWAQVNNITEGVGGGRFAPDEAVTREQFVTLLWRYAMMRYERGYEKYRAPQRFGDADPVSDWAQDAMCIAIGAGIVQGRGTADGTRLAAGDTCTRAEAVTMLYRFVKLDLTDKEPSVSPELTDSEKLDALADTSLALFRAMQEPGENTVTSPLSVIYALAMLYNGATGETKAQLQELFKMTAPELSELLGALAASLPDANATVRLADSMWLRKGVEVKPEYLALNQEKLGAELFLRDFDAATLRELNAWVSEKTDGMIPSILNTLSPDAVLVLLNALLFKGAWSEAYNGTSTMDFHAANGETQQAEMLRSVENTYLHDENAEGFLKPFQGYGHYAFAVLVPKKGMTPAEYLATLDGEGLRTLLQGERYDMVRTGMPKFRSSFESDLTQVFPKLGLTDLRQLNDIAPGLFVSDAIHKAVIDVNEDGVSAAAVTAIVVSKTALPEKEITVIADRPYVYMIVDMTTHLPLFIGVTESVG